MAKKSTAKTVEALKHDEAKRKNIPTAEFQSVLEKEQQDPKKFAIHAIPTSILSSFGAGRMSRIGATSSSMRLRSTSRKRSTQRC